MQKQSIVVNFSISRPVTVLMIFLALLVMGCIAYWKISVELLPRGLTFPILSIQIPYRNSNPTIVEQQVTKPLEEYLSTVRKLRKINSRSTSSASRIKLEFDSDTNMKLAYSQVQDRISRARLDFPDEVGQEFIWKFDLDDTPILWMGIAFDQEITDPYHLIENHIRNALVRLDGVARADIFGPQKKIVAIDIDKDNLRKYHIELYQLIRFLHSNNFSLAAGDIYEGDKQYFVRSVGYFKTLEEIRRLKITPNLQLSDIAQVDFSFEEQQFATRIDTKKAFFCAIYKESNANTVKTCQLVQQFIRREVTKNPQLKNVSFSILWNQGETIENSLDNLKQTLLGGAMLAILVLLFFLRSARMTMLITISIPLSLMIAIIIMYFSGASLNTFSLMGLTLGVGMLVDNAVVVVENIDRYKRLGFSKRESALRGAGEVGLAVSLSTSTTLVVFLPLILMNEDKQFKFIMSKLGFPVCYSLVASLIVALIFVPLASLYLGNWRGKRKEETQQKIGTYQKILRWTIHHRFDASILLLLLLVSAYIPYTKTQATDQGISEERRLVIQVRMSRSFDLKQSSEKSAEIEKILYSHKKDLDMAHMLADISRGKSRIVLFLTKSDEAKMTLKQIVEKLKEILPETPGIRYKYGWESGGTSNKINVRLVGPDTETLYALAEEVEERLRLIPELEGVGLDDSQDEEEIHVTFERDMLFDLGFSSRIVTATISYALRGNELPRFKAPDREIEMVVRYSKKQSTSKGQIENITMLSPEGLEVPITVFSEFRMAKGLKRIVRENHKTSLQITAIPTEGSLKQLRQKLIWAMTGLNLPQGYSWHFGSRFERLEENNRTMIFAFLMSVTFVFLLMGILFESFVLPFSILASIPFAVLGVLWGLFLMKTPFEIMSGIGMVILAGIVVNNAIVLVDCINRLRKEGHNRSDAIIIAGGQRLRPIIVTAATTILGLIPMAIGKAHSIGIPYYPLARTVISGLAVSTLLTLLAVPLFYTFCDDVRFLLQRWTQKILLK